MRTRRPRAAPVPGAAFAGFRFPPEVIVVAVRWYLRFGLSYRDVENCSPSGASTSITSPSTGGCSGSRRCWLRLLGRVGTPSATAGRSMRPTSRWPANGATYTGRSTSSGRSSTCWCRHVATPRPLADSSSEQWARPRSRPLRSRPIRRRCTRPCWRNCYPRPGTAPTNMATTGWSVTTAG
jgi:hypothetical protein